MRISRREVISRELLGGMLSCPVNFDEDGNLTASVVSTSLVLADSLITGLNAYGVSGAANSRRELAAVQALKGLLSMSTSYDVNANIVQPVVSTAVTLANSLISQIDG